MLIERLATKPDLAVNIETLKKNCINCPDCQGKCLLLLELLSTPTRCAKRRRERYEQAA